MHLRLNLGSYLRRHNLSAYRLVNEVRGRVSPGTVYALARRPAQRIDLETVGEVMQALSRLTGETVELKDVIEQVSEDAAPAPEPELSHLTRPADKPAFDPTFPKRFVYSGKGRTVPIEGGPSSTEIIAEGRGRTRS